MGESLSTKNETIKVCHALLQNPKFFALLLQIDNDLAAQMHATQCPCGGVLHRANYPRKPRACPKEVRADFESRLSFCCNRCRKRSTPMSVRFLGRRVYLGLAVVLAPQRRSTLNAVAVELVQALAIPARTIARWRHWWLELFPSTTLWQAACARFMPPSMRASTQPLTGGDARSQNAPRAPPDATPDPAPDKRSVTLFSP